MFYSLELLKLFFYRLRKTTVMLQLKHFANRPDLSPEGFKNFTLKMITIKCIIFAAFKRHSGVFLLRFICPAGIKI